MELHFDETNIKQLLDEGISKKRIIPFFQPKYNSITGKINGAEALARWMDDDGKLIPPDSFIPVLEKSCLITRLDWYILRQTCELIKTQLSSGITPVTVSVNFSRAHTYEPHFTEELCRIVDSYEIPRKYIEAEITESALEKGKSYIIDFISEIREAGFNVAIDDFGSGLSSLNFVKDVPASVLKIDKSLLSKNCEDTKERIVLSSIFDFAHRLNLTTVAEGVETIEQLGFLRTCGCELIQGFYFSRPLPSDEYISLFSSSDEADNSEDILITQATASANQLLLDAVFMCYPLVIFGNITRNSFYMMAYDNFSTQSCPSTGIFSELIEHGAATMHPDDQQLFRDTFNVQAQKEAYQRGQNSIKAVTRQLGDDGIYRKIETTNFFVKNPAAEDILVISLSKSVED